MTPVTRAIGSLLVVSVLPTAATPSDGWTRHSGTVIAIDPQRGELILEELGPGRGGQFIEVTLDAEDIAPGELVTAECTLERGRLVARRVTLAERALPPSSPGLLQP